MVEEQIVLSTQKVEEILLKSNSGYKISRLEKFWLDNNKGVRKDGLTFSYTDEETLEYIKCKLGIDIYDQPLINPDEQTIKMTGVQYFAETFCKIRNDYGIISNIKLRDYQKKMMDLYIYNRFSIIMSSRQSGKTITAALTILYYCIFNNKKNVLIAGNKLKTAEEIVDKIKNIYYELPFWLKPGVNVWNQGQITFSNGCIIKISATTKTAAIGFNINFLYLDEFAHVKDNVAYDFYRSIFPTVSSFKNSKIAITSTPNGYNLFWKLLTCAEKPEGDPEKNTYKSMRVYWHEVPGRFTTSLTFNSIMMEKYNVKIDDVYTWIKNMGFSEPLKDNRGIVVKEGIVLEERLTEMGKVYVISMPNKMEDIPYDIKQIILQKEWENPLSDYFRTLKFNDNPLNIICNISSWKEDAIKDIGSLESFNQEYDLQFLAGSKMVLDSLIMNRVKNNIVPFKFIDIPRINERLFVNYEKLQWKEDFNINDVKNKYFTISIDLAEGLGGDYSVVNIFEVLPKNVDDFPSNIKSLYDFFKLDQVGIFHSNNISVEELAELCYVLFFEVFNDNNITIVLEINHEGNMFVKSMRDIFNGRNDYGQHVFARYKHRIEDKLPKIGIKLRQNKNTFVKKYQSCLKNEDIIIHHEGTLHEMTRFIKKETSTGGYKFEADSGSHDDITMTIVEASSIFENVKFHDMVNNMFDTLSLDFKNKVEHILNISPNIEATDYSILRSAHNKAHLMRQRLNWKG